MTGTRTLARNNDLALERAKAEGYTGLVVKEFVAKVIVKIRKKRGVNNIWLNIWLKEFRPP